MRLGRCGLFAANVQGLGEVWDICVPSAWLTEVDECLIVQVIDICSIAFGQSVQKLNLKTTVEEKVPSARIWPNPLLAAGLFLCLNSSYHLNTDSSYKQTALRKNVFVTPSILFDCLYKSRKIVK